MMDETLLKVISDAITAAPGIAAAVAIVWLFVGHLNRSEDRTHETLRQFSDSQQRCAAANGSLAQQIAAHTEAIRHCKGD